MKPLALLLAALCGAIIASAIKPRPSLRLDTKAPDMPANIAEVQSMENVISMLRELLKEARAENVVLKARAVLSGMVKE